MVSAVSARRGAMASAGQGIGAALGQGIAAGIRGQIGAVASAAASIVRSAISAARSAGAITSPSRLMRLLVGRELGKGVEVSILDSLRGIEQAARRMVIVPDLPGYQGRAYAAYAMAGVGASTTYGGQPTSIVMSKSMAARFTSSRVNPQTTCLTGSNGECGVMPIRQSSLPTVRWDHEGGVALGVTWGVPISSR